MKRMLTIAFVSALALGWQSGQADAWEPATTHAGLTEQAALHSALHKRLHEVFDIDRGLYGDLSVPSADAPELFVVLGKLNPTHGYVPNSRGEMGALSWLVAGSVIADMPSIHASNHFFDPHTGKALSAANAGISRGIQQSAIRAGAGAELASGGMAATAWWRSAENPMGLVGFHQQFRKAVSASTKGERDRHLAGSLLAAGSMLHVLQDMGSPSHVRDDQAAHQQQVGSNGTDRASRFERIAALAFGRLGVADPRTVPELGSLASHFSNSDGTGLADLTSSSYFSQYTLPRTTTIVRNAGSSAVTKTIAKSLRRPLPAPSQRLDIVAARNQEGATWSNESGVCLARYQWRRSKISWSIDDDCALEQLEAILPMVAGYSASFLDSLYSNDLSFRTQGRKIVVIGSQRFGQGTVRLFADAPDGTRTEYHSFETAGSQANLGTAPPPPGKTSRISVLFDGKDVEGAAMLAATGSAWPPNKK